MTKQEQLTELFSAKRFLSASEIRAAGIPSAFITGMLRSGKIVRAARGVYSSAESAVSETDDLELLAHIVPSGVVCLVSALRFLDLTDETPHEISLAVPHGYHTPNIAYPPVRFFTFSGAAFTAEIRTCTFAGTAVKVYSLEKTLADCFKYRNKIGLDVAVAALREAAGRNRIDYDSLWNCVKICRVSRIIRPYLEAVQ